MKQGRRWSWNLADRLINVSDFGSGRTVPIAKRLTRSRWQSFLERCKRCSIISCIIKLTVVEYLCDVWELQQKTIPIAWERTTYLWLVHRNSLVVGISFYKGGNIVTRRKLRASKRKKKWQIIFGKWYLFIWVGEQSRHISKMPVRKEKVND